MKRLWDWWQTSCERCQQIRQIVVDAAKLAGSILMIALLMCSGLFFYWVFMDTAPDVFYGPNQRVEFAGEHVIFHLDAMRMRGCPTEIQRKIAGCGQIDLPTSFASTPVGQKAGPISFPLTLLFQSFSRESLSGNVCMFSSQASSYCNPAQRLLHLPIVTQTSISFIPVPRAKSYDQSIP